MVVRPVLCVLAFAAVAVLPAADQPAPTWADEFNTDGAPDAARWDYEVGFIRNKEAQYYTKARRENAWIEGGNLVISALKEDFEGKGKQAKYTAASLITKGKYDFHYGRIEVRAKIPEGRGIWPAIWFLGTDQSKGWPKCGEIDLMEYVGFDPNTLHFNIHTGKYNHVKKTNKGKAVKVPDAAKEWHVYALEWYKDRLEFFLDGKQVFSFADEGSGSEAWPYDRPHYLILNVAIGGAWGGMKGIDDAIFPQRMLVDYVRYWKRDG